MKFNEAAGKLASLTYSDFNLIDLVNIGKSVDNFKTSTLSKIDKTPAYDSSNDLVAIDGLKICLKYQRKMRLKKLVNKLTGTGGFKKEAAGHIDVAIRPDGSMYVWDGFRRAFMAGLVGLEYIPASIYNHPKSRSVKECEEYEALMFKIRNADIEKMKPEEIFRSKIIYRDKESLDFLDFLINCKLDVENLNVGNGIKELSGMTVVHDMWKNENISRANLCLSAHIIQETWKTDPTISGYLMIGLARFLDANDEINSSFDIDEIVDKFRKFVLVNPPRKQEDLTRRRLNSKQSGSIAYYIAIQVMEMSGQDLKELVGHLNLDSDDINVIDAK